MYIYHVKGPRGEAVVIARGFVQALESARTSGPDHVPEHSVVRLSRANPADTEPRVVMTTCT